ncbi:MAG: acyltransferase family protein [Desulfobacterium sp.]|nr:acyltransferase family protein [Desulfobacterium sp.]MBU3946670.1 acyltransferase family protein [Pseudomonadota bacterium]MBU4037695.1 acyltransferase family protein [Pseudomonadota bacterium]
MKNLNNESLNIARAIAIICIVLGHASFPEYVWRFVSFFHVPIFFFISGYFYKEAYSLRPIILIKKRIQNIYFPFLAYQFFFLLIHKPYLILIFTRHCSQLKVKYRSITYLRTFL